MNQGFQYAGIEYGGECFCDNTLAGSAAPAGECSMGCSGDKTQPCGGSWRMNVFKVATAAPAATSAAAASGLPAGWTNSGCNADKPSNRVINGLRLTANNMTWSSCVSQCASRGYWYAGVEYGSECYCGFAATLSPAEQSSCNMKCSGDSSINCGGPDRIQVFYNAEAEAKGKSSASSLPGNWKSYGCVVDSTSARALQPYRTTNGQMSYNLCAQTCQANGYSYAGVEYGNECYCGNEPKIQDAASGCNMACAGDPASMCGGAARMNLFYNGDLVSSPGSAANANAKVAATTTASSSSASSSSTAAATTPSTTASTTSTTSTTSTAAATTPTASYVPPKGYRACYSDGGFPRTLNGTTVYTDAAMTNEMCITRCAAQGFALAGTEYNRECYCGNYLNLASQIAESRCSWECFGNKDAKCGGSFALSIYETNNGTVITTGQAPATPPARRSLVKGGVRLRV